MSTVSYQTVQLSFSFAVIDRPNAYVPPLPPAHFSFPSRDASLSMMIYANKYLVHFALYTKKKHFKNRIKSNWFPNSPIYEINIDKYINIEKKHTQTGAQSAEPIVVSKQCPYCIAQALTTNDARDTTTTTTNIYNLNQAHTTTTTATNTTKLNCKKPILLSALSVKH